MVSPIRIVLAAVLILVLVVTAGQFALPRLAEERIEWALTDALDDVRWVRAEVRAWPPVIILGGRFTSINLDVRRATVGAITVDAILLDGQNVKVDMSRLLAGEGVYVESAQELRATFVIDQDDLNHYFWEQVNHSQFFSVALRRGRAELTGRIRLLGREMDVRVSGDFRVDGPSEVTFVPREVTVENTRVPQLLLDAIAHEWGITLALYQDAIPLVITDLLVEDGKLFVYGTHPQAAANQDEASQGARRDAIQDEDAR